MPDPGLPLSFIDCESRSVVHANASAPYTTLSYVSGASSTNAELPDYTLPDPLPWVIEDAIEVTKSLGCTYLWVDRYCIPQKTQSSNRS
ncbi:HET-domain-containing protein [Zopfia rhizophila CBS 207.26]|uniref:HET-domain-containing protein n=1 Tax=Zopfia rhizophila CBS 207.26 TaxID=1314779 RepID=A0A6A6DYK3_9PEZI|nr:HET-domain-containing protein [Zopfia rhizophila CBS 207.26]